MVRTQGPGKGCTVKVYVSATSLPYLVVDMVCQVFLIAVHVPRCLQQRSIPKYPKCICTCMHTYHLIVYVHTGHWSLLHDHCTSEWSLSCSDLCNELQPQFTQTHCSVSVPETEQWVENCMIYTYFLCIGRQPKYSIDDCWTEAFSTKTGSMETVC